MGGYSSEEDRRKKKKKSHRHSCSPTDSIDSRSSSKRSKHRKTRRRSRTRSRDRRLKSSHRSRSTSRGRRRRSRSSSRRRRRSHDRYRSRSRGRRSYSRSRRSPSRSRRSTSRSRRSRSHSHGRRRQSRSSSSSRTHSKRSGDLLSQSLADMSPTERAQAQMQLAIEKANAGLAEFFTHDDIADANRYQAVAADEAIRQRHGVETEKPVDTKKRQDAIKSIESDGFSQQAFKSGRANQDKSSKTNRAEFSFGTSLDYVKSSTITSVGQDEDSLMHPRFSEDPEMRKSRWLERLKALREQLAES